MIDFFNLNVGDKVEINEVIHTIRGKSLGRDWRAIRTNHGLVHLHTNRTFNLITSNSATGTVKNELEEGDECEPTRQKFRRPKNAYGKK
jgi:hypothetical protein